MVIGGVQCKVERSANNVVHVEKPSKNVASSSAFLLLDTFAGDKTRVSLISWRATRLMAELEDCEMTFPDKSWLIVDSAGEGASVLMG